MTQKNLIRVLKNLVNIGKFPHLHFCGPQNEDVLNVVNEVISDHYTNKSMIMQVHILDNMSESHLVQMITAFCQLQPVVADVDSNKPKVIIIHQQNETLNDNLIHFLEDRMSEKRVKFVFITSSMHVVPAVLLNKMVSFTIHPQSTNKSTFDTNDTFYKIINDTKLSLDDYAERIIQWSTLQTLCIPTIIYDAWFDNLSDYTPYKKYSINQ